MELKVENICGEDKDIYYDKKVKRLNLELVNNKGCPLIVFQDWTGKDSKHLFALHLKEAVELKAIIDNLVIDWTEDRIEMRD